MQFLIGFLLSGTFSLLAWRARALSASGAWAATLCGGLIFGAGGWAWAALLLAFFISSSALSRLFRRHKLALNEKFSKGSQRDWAQVGANGGLGALLAVSLAIGLALPTGLWPGPTWLWAAYAGAIAAVNADTWATEIGVLSRSAPRLITNGRVVERGTSGALTLLGSAAALAGAALIALLAALLSPAGFALALVGAVTAGGLAGSLFDSLLGATLQAIYHCPACQKETEQHPTHRCGSATSRRRGWPWVNNEVVNFLCSMMGAAVAALLWGLFQ